MMRRMLDATAADFARMDGAALKESIRAAEGRTLAAEVICTDAPPVDGVSHGELAAAMGADIIVLDRYDTLQPQINGLPPDLLASDAPLAAYKRLLGRPLGINMIVAASDAPLGGRLVDADNLERAAAHGVDIIYLYARPGQGGTSAMQRDSAAMARRLLGDAALLVGVPSFSQPPPRDADTLAMYKWQIGDLLSAGCAGIGLPMPGSKQGWQAEPTGRLVDDVHAGGGLAWMFVTGSVEGAQPEVMRSLALLAKQLGVDAVRLDEAGLSGMPEPENIHAFSLALRGKRHTYRRMAASILR